MRSKVFRMHLPCANALSLVWDLEPLNEKQTGEYVRRRLEVAGGKVVLFDDDAIREVYSASGGLPRMINNICDITLMIGCAANASRIDRPMVLQAVEDGIAASGGTPPLDS